MADSLRERLDREVATGPLDAFAADVGASSERHDECLDERLHQRFHERVDAIPADERPADRTSN